MQVSVQTTSTLERRLTIQVPAEEVEREIDNRLRSYGRRAKLKGFRPGKAPIHVIRQHYGPQVRQEVLSDLMQTSYARAITQEKLQPAGGPKIETHNVEPGQDLEYTATIEVYPEIKLKGLNKIKVQRPAAGINDDDVDAMLESLRKQKATWAPVNRPASQGDRAIIDMEGTIRGQPFEGGSGTQVPVELGAGRMLKTFEAGLEGIEGNEERTFEVIFPEDYATTELAGKTAEFKVFAHAVEARQLPEIDEAFLASYGVHEGGLDKLRAEVRKNMEHEMAATIRTRVKEQVLAGLVQANDIELPQGLVDEEIERLRYEARAQFGTGQEMPLPARELFQEQAERRVRVGLLVGELIRSQGIELDAARVENRARELAAGYEDPAATARAFMNDQRTRAQIESLVLEDQVIDWLLEQSDVTEKSMSFRELMHFESD